MIEDAKGDVDALLNLSHLTTRLSDGIKPIQMGKLLIKLTNAVNALSSLTVYDMLRQPGWRRVIADQIQEALAVFKAAGHRFPPGFCRGFCVCPPRFSNAWRRPC